MVFSVWIDCLLTTVGHCKCGYDGLAVPLCGAGTVVVWWQRWGALSSAMADALEGGLVAFLTLRNSDNFSEAPGMDIGCESVVTGGDGDERMARSFDERFTVWSLHLLLDRRWPEDYSLLACRARLLWTSLRYRTVETFCLRAIDFVRRPNLSRRSSNELLLLSVCC